MLQSPMSAIPAFPEILAISPVEAWLNLVVGFLLVFSLVMVMLPRAWSLALLHVAFPFLKPRK
jgi:hypothetical protein